MSGIPSDQVMAILRLKQWAFDRAQLRHGRTAKPEFSGWRERRQREADSRQVRVMDFERALAHLDPMLRAAQSAPTSLDAHLSRRHAPQRHRRRHRMQPPAWWPTCSPPPAADLPTP